MFIKGFTLRVNSIDSLMYDKVEDIFLHTAKGCMAGES